MLTHAKLSLQISACRVNASPLEQDKNQQETHSKYDTESTPRDILVGRKCSHHWPNTSGGQQLSRGGCIENK